MSTTTQSAMMRRSLRPRKTAKRMHSSLRRSPNQSLPQAGRRKTQLYSRSLPCLSMSAQTKKGNSTNVSKLGGKTPGSNKVNATYVTDIASRDSQLLTLVQLYQPHFAGRASKIQSSGSVQKSYLTNVSKTSACFSAWLFYIVLLATQKCLARDSQRQSFCVTQRSSRRQACKTLRLQPE